MMLLFVPFLLAVAVADWGVGGHWTVSIYCAVAPRDKSLLRLRLLLLSKTGRVVARCGWVRWIEGRPRRGSSKAVRALNGGKPQL